MDLENIVVVVRKWMQEEKRALDKSPRGISILSTGKGKGMNKVRETQKERRKDVEERLLSEPKGVERFKKKNGSQCQMLQFR